MVASMKSVFLMNIEKLKYIKRFLLHGGNMIKTVMFNFKLLPFNEAIHLPIFLYGEVDISQCTGQIKWITSNYPEMGSWIIGQSDCRVNGFGNYNVTRIAVLGTLILGETGRISNGCRVYIRKEAIVQLGTNFLLNDNGRIGCYLKIIIGNNVRFSWDCQVFDTDFHYLVNKDNTIKPNKFPVFVGDNVLIGNRVTLSKGAAIGDNSTIASNSLINHDFKNCDHVILAGIPGKIIKQNYRTLLDWEQENDVDKYFYKYPKSNTYSLSENES